MADRVGSEQTGAAARRNVALALVYASGLATLIALSGYHDNLNPDTIIVYFVSLVRWTPFFWTQDRYGMLIPALTQWLTEPLANVIAQNAAHVVCSILSFFLLARLLFPHLRWTLVGAGAILLYTGLEGWRDVEDFYTPWQIYTPAMVFGLSSLLVARRNLPLALLLVAVAEWCNFSIFLLTGLVTLTDGAEVLARRGIRAARHRLLRPSFVVALGAVFGEGLRRWVSGNGSEGYAPVGSLDALRGWVRIVYHFLTSPRAHYAVLLVPLALGLGVLGWLVLRDYEWLERRRVTLRRFVGAQFVAFAYIFIVGASAFAPGNGYPHRYLIPSLMIWSVAWMAIFADLTPVRRWGWRRRSAFALAVVPVIFWRFGTPSIGHARRSVADALAPRYLEVPPECTHVLGDYYRTWPVAFYSRFIHARTLWAVTFRSDVTADLWAVARFKSPVLCFWADDRTAANRILTLPEFAGFTVETGRGTMILRSRP